MAEHNVKPSQRANWPRTQRPVRALSAAEEGVASERMKADSRLISWQRRLPKKLHACGDAVRKHVQVTSHYGSADARAEFEAMVACVEGRRLLSVDYWDILEPADADWDYGDWHHAVMGVQLGTDQGPVTVIWTAAFFAYGVEVFLGPISEQFIAEGGPHRVGPDIKVRSPWTGRIGSLVSGTALHWTHVEVGPAVRSDGQLVGSAYTVDVPTVLRLDLAAGPVWFVAAMPQGPDMQDAFIMGDEIMVVFSAEKMRSLGFSEPSLIS